MICMDFTVTALACEIVYNSVLLLDILTVCYTM